MYWPVILQLITHAELLKVCNDELMEILRWGVIPTCVRGWQYVHTGFDEIKPDQSRDGF